MVATSLKGQMKNIGKEAKADPAATAKYQKVVKAAAEAGAEAKARIAAGVAQAADASLADLKDEIDGSKGLRKMAYPKKK